MIYERLEQLRNEKGLTWKHLNTLIDGYRGKLTELKKGKTTLEQSELEVLAKVLETTVDYLTGKTDIKEKPSELEGFSREDIEIAKKIQSLTQEQKLKLEGYVDSLLNK